MDKYPIVYLEYLDIMLCAEQKPQSELDHNQGVAAVSGFLLKETEEAYYLTREIFLNLDEEARGSDDNTKSGGKSV